MSKHRPSTNRSGHATQHRLTLKTVGANVLWGVGWGLAMAILWSAIVWLKADAGSATYRRLYGVTAQQVATAYVSGGILGGAVLGLLRPLCRYQFGAMVTGFVAFLPVAGAVLVAQNGSPTVWSADVWRKLLIISAFLGPILALMIWWRNYSRSGGG